MARFHGLLLVAGVFAACGGEGAHNAPDGAAGAAGTTASTSGASSLAGGGSGASTAGSGGAQTAAGTGGHAGAAGSSGLAGAGAHTGGSAGAAGSAGSAGAGGAVGGNASVSTPEMLVPTVKAFCAAARTCCAQQSDPVHLDDCESVYPTRDETSKALMRGTVTVDAADLAKCQAAYVAAATSCEENSVLAACAGIVRGNVAEGGACFLGTECAGAGPKVCLVAGGQDSPGVCKATPGGKAGDRCALTCRPNELCTFTVYGIPDSPLTPCLDSDGLFCNNSTENAKCEAIHALGAACQQDDECGYAAYCDGGGSYTCKKRGQLNDPCGSCISSLMCKDGKCQSPPLSVGGVCDGYTLGPY